MLCGPEGIGKTSLIPTILQGRPSLIVPIRPAAPTRPFQALGDALDAVLAGGVEQVAIDVAVLLGDRVLVVEDVERADPRTWQVLAALAGRVSLLLTSTQPPPGSPRSLTVLAVEPLSRRAAEGLLRRIRPGLAPGERAAIAHAAAGSPLALAWLPPEGADRVTSAEAQQRRLAEVDDRTADALGRLALHGAPLTMEAIGLNDGTDASHDQVESALEPLADLIGPVVDGTGRVWFRHDTLREHVVASLDADARVRLREDLVAVGPPAESARHLLELGRAEDAAFAAVSGVRALHDPVARAELLSIAVTALGPDAPSRLRLNAAAALIHAGHPVEAEQVAADLKVAHGEAAAEAHLYRAQAALMGGDSKDADRHCLAGLAEVQNPRGEAATRLHVERAVIAVRDRVADPGTGELVERALQVSSRTGVARSRARNVEGRYLSHLGRDGWETAFADAARLAHAAGDHEEECAAAYWRMVAHSYHGQMSAAVALGEEMITRTDDWGMRRWRHAFLGARALHLMSVGGADSDDLQAWERLLHLDPTFRHRVQVEGSLVLAAIDADDLDSARDRMRRMRQVARGGQDLALIASFDAELALATRDAEGLAESVRLISSLTDASAVLVDAVTSAAIHLSVRSGEDLPLPAPRRAEAASSPLRETTAAERRALAAAREHPTAGYHEFVDAARLWDAGGLGRFARRAWLAAAELAVAAGDLDRAEDILDTLVEPVEVTTRRAGLVRRTLQAAQVSDRLTPVQRQVLGLVGEGMSSKAIAARLGTRPATVDSQINAALKRLGCATRAQAAALVRGQAGPQGPVTDLDADQVALIELLREGVSTGEAAARLGISPRTAARRLAAAREARGVRTTAQLLG